jgi:predicted RNA-binding protein YlqC (UPF0109 family)
MTQLDCAISAPEGLTVRLSPQNCDVAEIIVRDGEVAHVALRDLTKAVYALSNERLKIRTSERTGYVSEP